MKPLIALILTIATLWSVTSHAAIIPSTQIVLSKPALDSTIQITSDKRYGGAIRSLKLRDHEFVNDPVRIGAEDHGLQLQSDISFDGYGECLNPTQAGSNPRMAVIETSETKAAFKTDDAIYTSALMGYWLEPGWNYGRACLYHPERTTAVNTTRTSNVLLQANYTLGYGNLDNVLTVNSTFNVPDAHDRADGETIFFAYLEFTNAEYINVTTGVTTPAISGFQQYSPIIMYTADEQYAVGIYSKDVGARYTWARGFDQAHVACYFHIFNTLKNAAISKQTQFIVGTKDEVEETMLALKALN